MSMLTSYSSHSSALKRASTHVQIECADRWPAFTTLISSSSTSRRAITRRLSCPSQRWLMVGWHNRYGTYKDQDVTLAEMFAYIKKNGGKITAQLLYDHTAKSTRNTENTRNNERNEREKAWQLHSFLIEWTSLRTCNAKKNFIALSLQLKYSERYRSGHNGADSKSFHSLSVSSGRKPYSTGFEQARKFNNQVVLSRSSLPNRFLPVFAAEMMPETAGKHTRTGIEVVITALTRNKVGSVMSGSPKSLILRRFFGICLQ